MLGEGSISEAVLGDDLLNHVAIVPHLGIKQNNDRLTAELSGGADRLLFADLPHSPLKNERNC